MRTAEEVKSELISLEELVHGFEPISIDNNAIAVIRASDPMVLDRTPSTPDLHELGTTGNTNYGYMVREDYNPELRGSLGLRTYDRMRKSDGQVKGTLRLVKTPVLAARWYVEPFSDKLKDVNIAKQIEWNLFKGMTTSWFQFLREALLMLDFGYYAFEKVFTEYEGKIVWKKLAPRHPVDIYQWAFDEYGGPNGFWMTPPTSAERIWIPIDKLAVFTYEMEAGNITGESVLRSAYKHWYYKDNLYKIDAIQKERHGIGIPIIVLPPNFVQADKVLANEIGENLRTNEKAHVVVPPGWQIYFLKLEGQPVDALASAEHHDVQIARNILGQFINAPSGSSQEDQQQLFLKATRHIAYTICDVINKYCIPQIVQWNWGIDRYPELKVRRIGDTTDWRTISFALRNFVGAGIIQPDDNLEAWIRDEMDLPKLDPTTIRQVATPQQPGMPRQSQAANMDRAKNAGGANVGNDKSGG